MDRRALLISATAALLGIALLRLYIYRFEQEATGGPTTRVLVLTRDLGQGVALDRELLSERALPQAYLESRHVVARDLEQVLGAKLGVAGRAGEALLWTDLSSLRERARQLSSLVPEGMRAITLELRAGAFDGLLVPGDRVDVLLVNHRVGANDLDAHASNVAQNVLVLAVGDDLGGPHTRHTANSRNVSLSVSLEQAALLADADHGGGLRLVLRNPEDLDITAARVATPAEPFRGPSLRSEPE